VTSSRDYFGPGVAQHYDDPGDPMFAPEVLEPTVDLLAELADGAAALELAIGTGRVAIPLAARAIHVEGLDLSAAMIAQMRRKPGGDVIPAVVADMTTARLGRTFGLVYLVFNTIGNVTSQEGQVAVFETASAHLHGGGCFVVEVGVPDLQRLPFGERFRPFTVSQRHLGIDEYDVVTQGLVSHHYRQREEGSGLSLRSIPFRYVWPAELDLMAHIAGLRLRHRWGDWDRRPFTAFSEKHVSVWEKTITS
jgi:hypothetical protein